MGDFGCAFCVSRQAAPSRGSWWGGRRFAPTPLRCSAWGRAAQLATFAALTALGQVRRVSPRSALRAPTPVLCSSPPHKSPLPGTARREVQLRWCSNAKHHCSAKSRPGRWQRACGAPRSTGFVARARSAPRNLICRTLFERSERSERSELCDGPQGRAPQGSRCAAPTASPKRCRLPGCDFAAPRSANWKMCASSALPPPPTRGPSPACKRPDAA